jgi:CubicO group peptidase (beta-lactamase class C family)
MKHSTILAAAALLISTSSSTEAQQPSPSRLSASVDSIIQADLISKGATSASLVITQNGKTLLERTYGFADVATQKKADKTTAYRLGSMTKHITAALLLKVADAGVLSLNDTIGKYVAGLKPEWNRRTIEQLLNHTSGLPREFRDPSNVGTYKSTDSLVAQAASVNAPTADAGTKFIYSNTGYMLLAAVVEYIYGSDYGTTVRDEIARPLGLKSLGWCGDMEDSGRVAKGYIKPPNDTLRPAPYIHPSQLLAGGLCSNAADIAKWNNALHTGQILSDELYKAMTTPRGIAATAPVPYGFGMYVRETPGGGKVLLTDGATPGYSNENVWYPAEKLSITLLTNTSGPLGADTNLTEAIGRIVLGRPAVVKK